MGGLYEKNNDSSSIESGNIVIKIINGDEGSKFYYSIFKDSDDPLGWGMITLESDGTGETTTIGITDQEVYIFEGGKYQIGFYLDNDPFKSSYEAGDNIDDGDIGALDEIEVNGNTITTIDITTYSSSDE